MAPARGLVDDQVEVNLLPKLQGIFPLRQLAPEDALRAPLEKSERLLMLRLLVVRHVLTVLRPSDAAGLGALGL
ncbi:Protein of unknown function [Propionibacterium freudenreichii subsp. freudenreichii]|uniref:Uncharacterized protein n=1 Tax=Propionibacterium freudenreichii subsp. freudenreichii TaxID=66712 RepID=A0A0B7P182_PROFF|nr:Protein of unknown function [Propionibacterium freudenreichii subsp. freudenreichii]